LYRSAVGANCRERHAAADFVLLRFPVVLECFEGGFAEVFATMLRDLVAAFFFCAEAEPSGTASDNTHPIIRRATVRKLISTSKN
jgi:hypothetical protein